MKILHTADWHLGQRLKNLLRDQEHQAFFEWLFDTINTEDIELLIVSGDIFVVIMELLKQHYKSNYLVDHRKQYYKQIRYKYRSG